jgi:DNA polymerase III psi subunit
MYDNLTLYYLNQMGIIPWINKAKLSKTSLADTSERAKLIVIIPRKLSTKSKHLMNQMLDFVDIEENKVEFITYSDQVLSVVLNGYQNRALLGVLCFDANPVLFQELMPFEDKSLSSIDLESLINSPIKKKQAFTELVRFKEHIWSKLIANEV